jgi:hypothetical protein
MKVQEGLVFCIGRFCSVSLTLMMNIISLSHFGNFHSLNKTCFWMKRFTWAKVNCKKIYIEVTCQTRLDTVRRVYVAYFYAERPYVACLLCRTYYRMLLRSPCHYVACTNFVLKCRLGRAHWARSRPNLSLDLKNKLSISGLRMALAALFT